MKLSVFGRHYVISAVLIAAISIIFIVITASKGTGYIESSTILDLEHSTEFIDMFIVDSLEAKQLPDLIAKIQENQDIQIDIFTDDTTLLGRDNFFPIDIVDSINALEFSEVERIRGTSSIREVDGHQHVFIAKDLNLADDKNRYIMRTSYRVKDENRFKSIIIRRIVWVSALLLALFITMLYFLGKSIRKRIDSINKKIGKISNSTTSLNIRKKDELRTLEESIKAMSDSYIELYNNVIMQKNDLRQIIEHLDEGILVLDKRFIVSLINRSAEDLLRINLDEVKGKNVLGILLLPEIRNLIENSHDSKITFSEGDEHFLAQSITIPDIEKRLIIIRDITEQFRTQQAQSDFVSNVSHELRTPITIIKGFAETLALDDLGDQSNRYIQTILRHTDRLISLVDDIMTLSRVQHEQHLEFESINLCAIIEEIIQLYKHKAEKKGITIYSSCCLDMPKVKGDRNLLEIVVSNLVDNAIKYNKLNGRIVISSEFIESRVVLHVEDTGVGISEKDQKRVFERFYTVDKARSRKVGGTGLGLSIVKKIVLLHDGELKVKSTFGEGSQFSIVIPIYSKN